MISWPGAVAQLTELVLAILLAPLLLGWVNQCRAWLQNKSGPGVLRPYLMLRRLFAKDAIVAHGASPLFRVVPYVLFGAMCMAAAIVPTLGTDLPLRAGGGRDRARRHPRARAGRRSRSPRWTSAPPSARSARGAR